MTALPPVSTKANLDSATDDPKLARTELATAIDNLNTARSYLEGLFGTDGTATTARNTLGLASGATTTVGTAATKNTGTASGNVPVLDSNGRLPTVAPLLHARDEKPSGTEGGGTSAATWHTRILNTVKINEISGAAVAASQITLPAGTYEVYARAPAFRATRHKLRFRNVTDGATTIVGATNYTNAGEAVQTDATLFGRFTIAATKEFELQHYIEAAQASNGLGNTAASGEVEVFAEVIIREVA